jgi:hypothetical protein
MSLTDIIVHGWIPCEFEEPSKSYGTTESALVFVFEPLAPYLINPLQRGHLFMRFTFNDWVSYDESESYHLHLIAHYGKIMCGIAILSFPQKRLYHIEFAVGYKSEHTIHWFTEYQKNIRMTLSNEYDASGQIVPYSGDPDVSLVFTLPGRIKSLTSGVSYDVSKLSMGERKEIHKTAMVLTRLLLPQLVIDKIVSELDPWFPWIKKVDRCEFGRNTIMLYGRMVDNTERRIILTVNGEKTPSKGKYKFLRDGFYFEWTIPASDEETITAKFQWQDICKIKILF